MSVLRAIISFPLFQKNNLKRVRNRDRWKSLFWGEKKRFQYLSPFQNKMKTRPVKQPVKNKMRGTQHSRFPGYFLWLLFCFGFHSNLEWLEKVKIFSLCWGKKKINYKTLCLVLNGDIFLLNFQMGDPTK